MSSDFYNYMPDTATEEDFATANAICAETSVSDASKKTNAQKWEFVKKVFSAHDCNLFSGINYENVYLRDNALACEAAAYVADLRSQYLEESLKVRPEDSTLHILFVINRIWSVKFRERVNLSNLEKVFKQMVLT
jgi:hypothetical protein